MRLLLTITLSLLIASCATVDDMKGLSSGHIGCTPDEISISHQSSTSVSLNWIATCKNKIYICNQDQSGYSQTVSCTERN